MARPVPVDLAAGAPLAKTRGPRSHARGRRLGRAGSADTAFSRRADVPARAAVLRIRPQLDAGVRAKSTVAGLARSSDAGLARRASVAAGPPVEGGRGQVGALLRALSHVGGAFNAGSPPADLPRRAAFVARTAVVRVRAQVEAAASTRRGSRAARELAGAGRAGFVSRTDMAARAAVLRVRADVGTRTAALLARGTRARSTAAGLAGRAGVAALAAVLRIRAHVHARASALRALGALGGRAARGVDVIRVQRDGAISRQGSTGHLRVGRQADARQRQDVADERRARTESRGAADLPVRVASSTAVEHAHGRVARRREGAADLEDEEGVGLALCVENQRPGQLRRGGEAIHARREREPAQILTGQIGGARPACQVDVAGSDIGLGLERDCVAFVYRASAHEPRWEAGDGETWADAQISDDGARPGIGDRRATEHGEALRRPQQRRGWSGRRPRVPVGLGRLGLNGGWDARPAGNRGDDARNDEEGPTKGQRTWRSTHRGPAF